MNSWKTKWHNSCRARYTVIFGDKIKQFITQNKDQSKKHSQKRFKLISLEHEALKDPLNYQIICKKCSPTSMCPRHGHIAFCSDHGPKPNPKAKVTKNGPTRISVGGSFELNCVYLPDSGQILEKKNFK